MIARQTAVQIAIQMKGQRNQVVDLYNSYFDAHPQERPRKYRVKYEDLLCATYVSSIFCKLGWCDIVPPECAAWRLYQNMDAIGCGVQDKNHVPNIGELIFFGTGKNMDNITHVGIVTEVKGTQIYYYDIQSVVGRHTCPVGYSYIWGYGIPDYASKDAQPVPAPTPEPAPAHEFVVGDLVTINPGAKWYKGSPIKLSCISDKWYISSIRGDRAVLGMNEAQTRDICSPIHTCDITLVNSAAPVASGELVEVTITVKPETLEFMKIIAAGNNITIGEVVDMQFKDYL